MNIDFDMRMLRKCEGQSDYSDRYEGKHSGVFVEAPANDGTAYPNVLEITVA